MESQENSLTVKSRLRLVPLVIFLAVVVFAVIYLYLADAFRAPPVVEVKASNGFDRTLRVVADDTYAPYSYIAKDGSYQGLDVELINELANRLQMNLDLRLMDWPSANRAFLQGEADIIMNMDADLIVNNHNMIATLPIAEKQYVVYGRKEVTSVADLYGRRVASRHHLPGLGLDDEITYIDTYKEIFTSLKQGEYEYAICPIQVGASFLAKLDMENEIIPSYAVTHLYSSLALHPKDTVLCVRLSAMLKQMQEEGRTDELDAKWINHRYENTTVVGLLKNHPWFGATVLFVILLVIAFMLAAIFQYRNARAQAAYNRQLHKNLQTIEDQRLQLKEHQDRLLEAKAKAEESSRAKSKFLFNMTHDIRTPMNAIIGYIELAKRESGMSDVVRDYLHKIDVSSQHMLVLINDILEMSRIENGKIEIVSVPMDWHRVIADVKDVFATQMQTKGIIFTAETVDMTHPTVLCDEKHLKRVMLNLISNAYKFTPKGGKVQVAVQELSATQTEGQYIITVQDSGIGMTKEFAAKVFTEFERERTSTVSGIQGTGLGMAISKAIVDYMGGTIEVDSAPGKGTKFSVHLTLPITEAKDDAKSDESANSQNADFNNRRLLLVDDIEVNREIAKMLLEGAGFQVETAVNGQEAVEKATANDYDAILMDIQMPVMDGYAATKAIRALGTPRSRVPIVAMTANAFSEDVAAAKAAGMDAHIAKPIDVQKMLHTLSEIL